MADEWATEVTDTSKKLFLVLFSAPNAGKTVLASRIALLSGRSMILTEESGHRALNDFPDLAANTKVRNYQTRADIFTALQRRKEGKEDFDTLILDTFTGIQKKEMKFAMTKRIGGRDNPAYFDVKRFHPDVPATQDYLLAENTWYPVMQMLATQDDVNVILNCHIQHPNPEKFVPGDVSRPKLPDAVWQIVNGKANVVAYMRKGGPNERFVSVQATKQLAGKTQIKNLNRPEMTDDEFLEGIRQWQSL